MAVYEPRAPTRVSLLAASALWLSLVTAGDASAAEGGPWVPKAQGSRIGAEFDWWPTHDSHTMVWDVVAQIQLARVAYLDLDLPFASWEGPTGKYRSLLFGLGNPVVGAHWADKLNNRIAFFTGGALAVSSLLTGPVSSESGGSSGGGPSLPRKGREAVEMTRAYAGAHRFVPYHILVRGQGGLEVRAVPELYYRLELAPLLAIPVGASRVFEVVLEVNNDIEARASFGVGGGMRLQAVFLTSHTRAEINDYEGDPVQTAMEPYFVYEPIQGFYAHAGVLVALDPGLGIGFEEGKVATIRIAVGGKW